jgi:hypothetical protein
MEERIPAPQTLRLPASRASPPDATSLLFHLARCHRSSCTTTKKTPAVRGRFKDPFTTAKLPFDQGLPLPPPPPAGVCPWTVNDSRLMTCEAEVWPPSET